MNLDASDSWNVLCELHRMTRTVQSHAEFMKVDKVFFQPIKEERDAYDHVLKAIGGQFDGNDDEGYSEKQLKKAEGHAYRALYDSLDYLHMIVTERIVEELGRYNEYRILRDVEEYGRIRTRLIEIHKEFVDCKDRKDSVSIDGLQKAQEYYRLVLEYLDLYNELRLKVLPEFWKAEMPQSGSDRSNLEEGRSRSFRAEV